MAGNMNQSIINLYDEYTHKPLPRREFMERLVTLTGSIAAANGALALLEPNAAMAQTIAADDPRLVTQDGVSIADNAKGYLVRPRQATRKGFVIVVHENRGLNAHIRDVARRVALGGFVAFAPDYLTPLGGTPDNPDTARDMFSKLPAEAVIDITKKMIAYGNAHPEGSGKTGIVGFCWGGGVVNRAAVTLPELAAGVVYYGVAPDVSKTGDIKAALMVHLAGLDERVNNTYPPYEAALKAAGKNAVVHRYEGVNHAFNNDTSAERFNKAAADLAWERTLTFFTKELAGPRTTG
jgi:carboxymethylenebutenolidase